MQWRQGERTVNSSSCQWCLQEMGKGKVQGRDTSVEIEGKLKKTVQERADVPNNHRNRGRQEVWKKKAN